MSAVGSELWCAVQVFTQGAIQSLHDKPIEIKRAVPREQMTAAAKTPRCAAVMHHVPYTPSPFSAASALQPV